MFEGKHIHFSPTDNKPLCSYSGKLCRQRRLNGYAFCIRHILEDKSAPFKQCSYVTRNNSQKCLNAIPMSQDRGYCHSHMQVIGIIPKTERKSKAPPIQKVDSGIGSSVSSEKSLSPAVANGTTKKDPGAVFKFEEDSSDVSDVFPYKNGLLSGTLNGKGKTAKPRNTSYNNSPAKDTKNVNNSPSKDIKNVNNNPSKDTKNVKSQNGFGSTAPKFTTKKITDKNKNVYTTVVPTTGNFANSNHKANDKVYHSKSKKSTCWNTVEADASKSLPAEGSRTPKTATRFTESELNSLHDSEDKRQFEQLKTLKQLDKSLLSSGTTLTGGLGGDAKLQVFPRLAVRTSNIKATTSINYSTLSPVTNHTSSDDLASQFSTENGKSEIVSTSCSPPLITRSNNSIIIKTEPQQAVASTMKNETGFDNDKCESIDKQHLISDRGVLFTSGSNISCSSNSFNVTSKNDHRNSIDKDLKNRHEFLAHVRNSFKSQYKSMKKACRFSERCEKSGQQKLRDSLMRCVRIDSSICAQVLLGSGLKLPAFCSPIKPEVEEKKDVSKKKEYDDYDFVDTDASLPVVVKKETAILDQPKVKKGKASNKSSTNTSAQKRNGKKNKEVEPICSPKTPNDKKETKEILLEEATKDSKSKSTLPIAPIASKRKLRRSDALRLSPESSLETGGVQLKESIVPLNNNNAEQFDTSAVKKQKLDLNEMPALETGLGLSVNDQSSSSHDEKTPSSAHQNINPSVAPVLGEGNHELQEILGHSQLSSSITTHRNQGLETVLNSVGSSENAGTPDGVITDASFDSTFEHSTSSQPDCEFSEDDLENSFELQIDPEIESQASRLLEDNVLTEADFTELFPDNRMSDHKFGRNDLQELGMTGLEFDVNDIDYSLFANIFPNFPRSSQPESISISNQF